MHIRILLLGSLQERNALRRSVLHAFGGRPTLRVEFDEHVRLSRAVESFDSCEQPRFVVTTPSVPSEHAVELLRHVRGCGRTMPVIVWRTRSVDAPSAAAMVELNAIAVTSDDPIFVTEKVVESIVNAALGAARATRPTARA